MVKKATFVKDTFAEYLGKKDHISASDIKNFLASPCYYYYKKYKEEKKESERHFAIGSALHEIILEPHQFTQNYIVTPKFDRRTTEGKANYNAWIEQASGKTMLMEDEMTMITQMAENATKNETFMALLSESHREVSAYTEDEKTGLKLRMRPDIMPVNKSTIVDIKTCIDSSPKKFKHDVYQYGYALSAAFYTNFLERENYVFAAIEKQAPYQTALYALSDESFEYGISQFRMGLDLIKWSYDNNYWCSHNDFEVLKECYQLDSLDQFFEILKKSQLITII